MRKPAVRSSSSLPHGGIFSRYGLLDRGSRPGRRWHGLDDRLERELRPELAGGGCGLALADAGASSARCGEDDAAAMARVISGW